MKRFYCLYFLLSLTTVAQVQNSVPYASFHTDNCELPLKPDHTISFETDEGTQMNVDISPDGKTVLFDLLGDLYSIPSRGGAATQLTRGLAVNACPIWSPDGQYIAYISDVSGSRHLTVRNKSGTFCHTYGGDEPQIEKVSRMVVPIWSSNSKFVICGRSIYFISGGRSRLPDEVSAIVGISEEQDVYYCIDRNNVLFRYNITSGTKTVVTIPTSKVPQVKGKVSPDGCWLSYLGAKREGKPELFLFNLLNGHERAVADMPFPSISNYSFSKDSKFIYIAYGGKIHRIGVMDGNNEIINFSANVKVDVGPQNYTTFKISNDSFDVRYTRYAHLSPNGRQLVFSALNRIYIKDLPNGIARILFDQPISQFQPCWSPDGKWITYSSWKDSEGGHLWRMRVNGGKPEQVTREAGQYHHPAWSPDGNFIVVAKGSMQLGDRDYPGAGDLQVIDVTSGVVTTLAKNVPLFNYPSFSVDGKEVIYRPAATEGSKRPEPILVSQTIKGSNLRVLAEHAPTPNDIIQLRQVTISPDGRYVVYSHCENLHIVSLANFGKPQLIFDPSQRLPVIRFAEGGVDPHWEENGKVLSWSYCNKYFRVETDKIIRNAEKLRQRSKTPEFGKSFFFNAPVIPDQAVTLNITVPRHCAKGTIVLDNARIITMRDSSLIERGTLIIQEGRITVVGKKEQVKIPEGSKVLNLQGKTIIPGFIDLHSHMRVPPDIFPQQSWIYLSNLAYGVTTARDPSSSYDQFGYGELLQTGQMIGPRFYGVGHAIRPKYNITSLNEARVAVRNRAVMGAIAIKQYDLPTRLQRQWLVTACREAGLNMTNEGGNYFEYLGQIKDGSAGIEHTVPYSNCYSDVSKLIAASGTYITPTLQVSSGNEGQKYFRHHFHREQLPKLYRFSPDWDITWKIEEAALGRDTVLYSLSAGTYISAAKQGGQLAMGSHGEDQGIGAHYEIWEMQMMGFSNMDALRAATIVGAGALGLQSDIGSIETGKIADLIILDKNPLEDIHNTREIKYVMKDGVLYEGETLKTIWPAIKKAPEWKLTK